MQQYIWHCENIIQESEAILVIKQIPSPCSFTVPPETIRKPFCISNRGESRNPDPRKMAFLVTIVKGFEPLTFVKEFPFRLVRVPVATSE